MPQNLSETISARPERLRDFISDLSDLLGRERHWEQALPQAAGLLRDLVRHDDWLPPEYARPQPDRYAQYLLYADPGGRFSVVSFVWGPGQSTPIHDHTVWGLIGMLRGAELSQRYARDASGRWLPEGAQERLAPGQVEAVWPPTHDVHRVSNAYADQASISIHVYGGEIGSIRRSVYTEAGEVKPFISGYTPVPLPNLWGAAQPGAFPHRSTQAVRADLIAGREVALLDVREEAPFAVSHPLFAANLPWSQIELQAWRRIPRRDTQIVVYDNGEGLARRAAERLRALGYTDVNLLSGGLAGWEASGGELFCDVNVPSKSFGELVEAQRHTPSLAAPEVHALLEQGADVVVVDARRFDEYHTMNIPGSTSVPGAELVLRVRELAPDPATTVIVNCAGRTRSIIGTQSLVNAGLPNPVYALRNGTIGWTLAGLTLEHGQSRRHPQAVADANRDAALARARAVADRAGVGRVGWDGIAALREPGRSLYLLDVRQPEPYEAGHLPGFANAPGGQLVQETDHVLPVRGARIVLSDGIDAEAGVRADMTASWLAQMGWDVHVLDAADAARAVQAGLMLERGARAAALPPLPEGAAQAGVTPAQLQAWLAAPGTRLIDLSPSQAYRRGHIAQAAFALRAGFDRIAPGLAGATRIVLSSPDGRLAGYAWADLRAALARHAVDVPVHVLEGGNAAWQAAGFALAAEPQEWLSPDDDRYRRPYEGTDNPVAAMQGYLDWEYGLVDQLARDATHGFRVI